MPHMTGEYPRAIPRATWLTTRARNAVKRPRFIGAVGVGAFIAALVALVLAPQQAHRTTTVPLPLATRPDTTPLLAALAQARTRLGRADSSLSVAREQAGSPPKPSSDTLNPRLVAHRDSIASAVNELDALLTRVETAPMPASYRALAESPQLASNARAKILLDSLADVERDREGFGTNGSTDPVFVALTSRATDIGHAIQSLAQARRDTLRGQIIRLNAPTVRLSVTPAPTADTVAWIAERDSAESLVTQAIAALADARQHGEEYDRAVANAKQSASLDTPVVALLAAALVIGIALGFGSAFARELRHPRVGDEHELERVTGARVLATIKPQPRPPDRNRRSADRLAPRYFDPGAAGYQLTYLHVARAGASRLMLTIAGFDPAVAAVIATNVAAIAAEEARSTILIDTDARHAPVAAVLRARAEPGLIDILDGSTGWAEATTQAMAGRDRTIDVLPSGVADANRSGAEIRDLFQHEATRLSRHYEAIVIAASLEHAVAGLPGALPIPDVIICARVGHTRIVDVQAALDGLRASGGAAVGIVLWDAPVPTLPTPSRIARAQRPLNTPVMQSLSPSS
jgi:Mrp family chromosome partitioning ATPase